MSGVLTAIRRFFPASTTRLLGQNWVNVSFPAEQTGHYSFHLLQLFDWPQQGWII